jgi:hypothetical protein
MTAGTLTTTSLTLGTSATITGGAGSLVATGGASTSSNTTITTGSGGGTITVGLGGSIANATSPAFTKGSSAGTGSESINLSASSAVSDTIVVNNATYTSPAPSTIDTYGLRATVTGFQINATDTYGDKVTFNEGTATTNITTKTVVAPVASQTLTANGELYTISNGVISFTGPIIS